MSARENRFNRVERGNWQSDRNSGGRKTLCEERKLQPAKKKVHCCQKRVGGKQMTESSDGNVTMNPEEIGWVGEIAGKANLGEPFLEHCSLLNEEMQF